MLCCYDARGRYRSSDTHISSCQVQNYSGVPGVCLFVCALGCFDPLCVRSPLETLESGIFIPYLGAVETVTCFTRRSTMESSVVSSLPDYTFIPTLASINPSLENVERVLSYGHISCAS